MNTKCYRSAYKTTFLRAGWNFEKCLEVSGGPEQSNATFLHHLMNEDGALPYLSEYETLDKCSSRNQWSLS
jgi:hypothetical protein